MAHSTGTKSGSQSSHAGKIVARVREIFTEAYAAGSEGKFFGDAWPESQARARLMRPTSSPIAAIERRDRALYFFEEGLREGHGGAPIDSAWHHSYSLVIAKDMAERAALRDG